MPKVLYYGDDVQLGTDAVNAALEKRQIVKGKVVRNWHVSQMYVAEPQLTEK
jgi:hypothetical protein